RSPGPVLEGGRPMVLSAAPVAVISAHQVLVLLLQVGLLLAIALGLGRLGQRVNLPAGGGGVWAGGILGALGVGHVVAGVSGGVRARDPSQMHMLDAVGLVGVLLLVGITGMSLDLGLLRRRGATPMVVSAGGLLVPLGFGIAAGFALPSTLLTAGTHRTVFAGFVGVAMCVSAIPVIAKTLLEMRLMHRNVGQLIISAADVGDVVGWLLLSVVSAMATTGVRGGGVALSVAYLVVAVLIAATAGRVVVRRVLRLAGRAKDPGVTITAVVLMLVLFAAGTQAMGMEAIVGAFFGGILIASSGQVHRSWLVPLRTFVMAVLPPLFFAPARLRMDLTALGRPVVLASAARVLLIAGARKVM